MEGSLPDAHVNRSKSEPSPNPLPQAGGGGIFVRDLTQGGGSSDSPLPWAIDISSLWDFRSALARREEKRQRPKGDLMLRVHFFQGADSVYSF